MRDLAGPGAFQCHPQAGFVLPADLDRGRGAALVRDATVQLLESACAELETGVRPLLLPLSAVAGAGLAVMMIGAVATHVAHAEWGMLVAASVILVLSATRAWLGRDDIRELAGLRPKSDAITGV